MKRRIDIFQRGSGESGGIFYMRKPVASRSASSVHDTLLHSGLVLASCFRLLSLLLRLLGLRH